MLTIFKSSTCGDVVMFAKNGKEILGVIGKNPDDAKGIVTLLQLPDAISALKVAIQADKARHPVAETNADEISDKTDGEIRLFQRAVPLLEMLERSLQDRMPVTWGV